MKTHKTPIYIFFGPPGSGKGEQSKRLSKHLSIPHISSGDLLRAECSKGTPLGLYFNEIIKKGHFPPDEHIVRLIEERIRNDDCTNGFILDGVPRTLNQAKIVDEKFLDTHKLYFIKVSILKETLLKRLLGRRVCPNCSKTYHIQFMPPEKENLCDLCQTHLITRNDDQEDVILERLKIFNDQFSQMLNYYKDRENWIEIQSEGSPQECFNALIHSLDEITSILVQTP